MSGDSREKVPITDADFEILRDLDLLDDDNNSQQPIDDFNPVLTANPLESFSLERERSRDKEKKRLDDQFKDEHEIPSRNSIDEEGNIMNKKRRIRKESESIELDPPRKEEQRRPAPMQLKSSARPFDKKLENLKRITGNMGEPKGRRAASESTKPSLNLMIPKGFETKESFSRRFKVIESLGEGGSSIVRKVACRRDGKICAVKSCKSNDSSSTKYIKKELKILQMLQHPNIITPYGIFESTSNVPPTYQDPSRAQVLRR